MPRHLRQTYVRHVGDAVNLMIPFQVGRTIWDLILQASCGLACPGLLGQGLEMDWEPLSHSSLSPTFLLLLMVLAMGQPQTH